MEWLINNHKVVFNEKEHTYLVDNKCVPSVTTILKEFFNDYANIPEEVLERAAMLGTEMHKEIEDYEKYGTIPYMEEVFNYIDLKNKSGIINIDNEIPIIYEYDNKVLFVGILDQLYEKDNKLYINDFKRNAKLNIDKVSLQTTMYKLGYEQSYNKNVEGLSVMQLRKDVAKIVELENKEEEVKNILDIYYGGNLWKTKKNI